MTLRSKATCIHITQISLFLIIALSVATAFCLRFWIVLGLDFCSWLYLLSLADLDTAFDFFVGLLQLNCLLDLAVVFVLIALRGIILIGGDGSCSLCRVSRLVVISGGQSLL